jgi:hypothetical protein
METGDDQQPTVDGPTADRGSADRGSGDKGARRDARFGSKPGAGKGSNETVGAYPSQRARSSQNPARAELTELLGRSVLEARTQRICRAYGLVPRSGGLSRYYLAREAGLELSADSYGVVMTIFLHFDSDDGFTPYRGEIPGCGGSVPRRAGLWAALGRPDESGEPLGSSLLGDRGPWDRWRLPGCVLHARYAPDGQNLCRATYTLPDRTPGKTRAA